MTTHVFISAETRSNNPRQNLEASEALSEELEALGVKFSACIGVYEGTEESSFMVDVSDAQKARGIITQLFNLAQDYEQDAIIILSGTIARLYFTNGAISDAAASVEWVNRKPVGDYTEVIGESRFLKVRF